MMTCSIEGCERPRKIVSTGLCGAHYARSRRYGDALEPIRTKPRGGPCETDECSGLAEVHGICKSCADRAYYALNAERIKTRVRNYYTDHAAELSATRAERMARRTPRKDVTGCGHLPYYARDLCQPCYIESDYQANRPERIAAAKQWRLNNLDDRNKYEAAYRVKNAEQISARQRAYHRAHAEEACRRAQDWYAANKERAREVSRAWVAANRDRSKAIQERRRARKAAVLNELTAEEWQQIVADFEGCCAYCGVQAIGSLSMDHVIPISVGGPHIAINIVPACRSCNSAKNAKAVEDFLFPYGAPLSA